MQKHWLTDLSIEFTTLNFVVFAVCFSRLWAPTRPKSRLPFAKPSESQTSKSRSYYRTAQEQPTLNTSVKRRADQGGMDSDYLFGSFLQRGKPKLVRQTPVAML